MKIVLIYWNVFRNHTLRANTGFYDFLRELCGKKRKLFSSDDVRGEEMLYSHNKYRFCRFSTKYEFLKLKHGTFRRRSLDRFKMRHAYWTNFESVQ